MVAELRAIKPQPEPTGPGIALKYDDATLRHAIEQLQSVVDRQRLEIDYIKLFDSYLSQRKELQQLDH